MNDDRPFRIALLVVWVIFGTIGVSYRLRSLTDERLDRWQEGAFILFGLRLSGVPGLVAVLVWMIDSQRMA
jgi:hypothetical protein